MSITLVPTPPSRQDPTNFAVRADAFLGALPNFATETNAVVAQVNTSASNAATNASAAATSASAAATSASNASTSASNAATNASAAATSASAAAASASAADTSASAASTSASAAATSASNASTSASNASASASNAAASASNASASASAADTSASAAAASASAADTSASAAATNASAAATSASAASTSEDAAATSASDASTSASDAATSALEASNSFSSFDDRYLGAKSSAPSLDNDGNPLLVGAIYWNSTTNNLAIWTGSAWNTAAATVTSGVNSFNSRIGNINLSSQDVTDVLNSTVDIVVGSITATIINATDVNSTSDAVLKTNIANIDPKLLQAIRPVSFDWKDTGKKSYGVIAQELQQILPELVHTREDGLLSVSYIPIIALLIQAVQELQTTVNKLQHK